MIVTHGSLCSGLGGFDLAAEWMEWQNVFHCEINNFCQQVLKYYWPNAKTYDNLKTTDFTIFRGLIDILTGWIPCQPYSTAGKRKGKDDNRHLWPEYYRVLKQIQPPWAVVENVHGLINWNRGMVFNEIQTDLEAAGYEVWSYVLPACSVGAPHRRDRVWFIAYNATYAASVRRNRNTIAGQGIYRGEQTCGEVGASDSQLITNSNGKQRRKGRLYTPKQETTKRYTGPRHTWQGGDTWKNFPTQPPIHSRDDGLSNRLDGITLSKWREESVKAFGNAIVPQVAFQIFKTIEAYEIRFGHKDSVV